MQIRINRATLANALRVAGEQYQADSQLSYGPGPEMDSLVTQFKRQAMEVRKLADDVEQADVIILID